MGNFALDFVSYIILKIMKSGNNNPQKKIRNKTLGGSFMFVLMYRVAAHQKLIKSDLWWTRSPIIGRDLKTIWQTAYVFIHFFVGLPYLRRWSRQRVYYVMVRYSINSTTEIRDFKSVSNDKNCLLAKIDVFT